MEALSKGYISSLDEFYYLARAILVKSENHYDQYDVAFQEYFKGIEGPAEINQQILDWLKDPAIRKTLTEEERALFKSMDFDKLIEEFEKRLKEQTEQHDGGGNWIGRGGTSPFGHSGYHPAVSESAVNQGMDMLQRSLRREGSRTIGVTLPLIFARLRWL